jgi:lysine 2,3-aminomutase
MRQATSVAPKVEIPVNEEEPPLSCTALEFNFEFAASDCLSPRLSALAQNPQWKDWQWQMRSRIRSVAALSGFFPSMQLDTGLAAAAEKFPLAITPYYASLIRKLDSSDPVFNMAVPQGQELWNPPFLRDDPLEEDHDMPVPGLVHRYPDRALLIVTSACAMYCRHCTRKRVTGNRESYTSEGRIRKAVEYLTKHPEIRDVVVSGGDPLTLPTPYLESILSAVRSVPSVDIIRLGTRTPVTLPMRITDELVQMLRKYHPIWVNTHFNHPCEITPAASEACRRLADAGVPLGNQSVLLKGINDDPSVMEELLRGLVRMRVRPYYLFQCDLVPGVEHFRTPLSRGIEIMEALRGRLSGLAIPTFVVDMPHGGGKVPVLPSYIVSTSPTHTVLRNFEGMLASYPEPYAEEKQPSELQPLWSAPSVWDLSRGHASKIQPENTARQARRKLRPAVRADYSAKE